LKEEQGLLIKHLLKQAKDSEKMFAGEEVKHKDDVISAMHDKWNKERQRGKQIEGSCKINKICSFLLAIININIKYMTCSDIRIMMSDSLLQNNNVIIDLLLKH
jgi:hypothetical protein